jgi:hypothetical protein
VVGPILWAGAMVSSEEVCRPGAPWEDGVQWVLSRLAPMARSEVHLRSSGYAMQRVLLHQGHRLSAWVTSRTWAAFRANCSRSTGDDWAWALDVSVNTILSATMGGKGIAATHA